MDFIKRLHFTLHLTLLRLTSLPPITPMHDRYELGTPVFGEFLSFFSADPLKLCQIGWGALLHSYFQVSLQLGSSPASGWATQGHSETCPKATPVMSWLCA